jgi:predicted AAA+ superfamily ATPase
LENAVYLHLRRKHPFGKGLFYFKEKYECDFLCIEKQSVSTLIQVCWNLENPETEKREIKPSSGNIFTTTYSIQYR